MAIEYIIVGIVALVGVVAILTHPTIQNMLPERFRVTIGVIGAAMLGWWLTRQRDPTPPAPPRPQSDPIPMEPPLYEPLKDYDDEAQKQVDDHKRRGPADDIGARLDRFADEASANDHDM